jgi:2-keto-3-deoxy-L-rhamnonate aldolase RhmA
MKSRAPLLIPPRGERSIGIARAQGYGTSFAEYLQTRSYAIIVQIETVAGVTNAQEIIEHDAVDAVLIGPYDLSGSFGIPCQIEAPQVIESIRSVLALCKKAGKPCGIFAATPEKASIYAAQGFEFIGVGMDTTLLLDAYKSIRERFS